MRESGYGDRPDYRVDIHARRNHVVARLGDEILAESTRCLLVDEQDHGLTLYFPRDDVRMELLEPTDHHTFCPFKGEASYWSVKGGGTEGENAAWSYEDPFPQVARLSTYVAFYQNRVQVELGVADGVSGYGDACGV